MSSKTIRWIQLKNTWQFVTITKKLGYFSMLYIRVTPPCCDNCTLVKIQTKMSNKKIWKWTNNMIKMESLQFYNDMSSTSLDTSLSSMFTLIFFISCLCQNVTWRAIGIILKISCSLSSGLIPCSTMRSQYLVLLGKYHMNKEIIHESYWLSDCCFTPNEIFSSYILVRISSMRW